MAHFYVTTPIYYVNDVPHVGHAYTTINADALARWHRLCGDKTFFLTGTDEHGLKIQRAAEANNSTPQAWADITSARFRECWELLDIDYDDFIRTTELRHHDTVSKFLQKIYDNGYIELRKYKGFYSVADEEYISADDVADYELRGRTVIEMEEENYFFKLSLFGDRLTEWIENDPNLIVPASKRNEVLGFIRGGLQDFSLSRTSLTWGIPIPWDSKHVTYVWGDALVNYLTAIDYGRDAARVAQWWPHVHHLLGKDILRFHNIFWPAMLMAADMDPPKRYGINGYLLVGGEKMSKTRLNAIHPKDMVDEFGVDGLRYCLLREVAFGNDGDFSFEGMVARYNSDLANNFGNLLARVLSVVEKKCGGIAPKPMLDSKMAEIAREVFAAADDAWANLQPQAALEAVWRLIRETNAALEAAQPWKAEPGPEVDAVMGDALEALRQVAILAWPAMPKTCDKLWLAIGLSGTPGMRKVPNDLVWGSYPGGAQLSKVDPLFPRKQ